MSKIWILLLLSSITTLLFVNPDTAVTAMLAGAEQSVELSIQLVALYGFWLGFFEILERTGAADFVARLLRPLIRRLFRNLNAETEKLISMNMSANLLGLGNAATPMGIGAINRMKGDKPFATDNMIMLIVISATSLQLLPSTVIGMRATAGSAAPTAFLLPCMVSTVASTVIGVLLVKLLQRLLPESKATRAAARKAAKKRTRTQAESL